MEPTPEQIKVFEFIKSGVNHGIIDAVAGSGKTSTIIDCAQYIPPGKSVLFCAFNRSIAGEIRNRFLQRGLSHINVKTIHALGFDILKTNKSQEYKHINSKYDTIIETGLKHNMFSEQIESLLEIHKINISPENSYQEKELRKFRYNIKRTLTDLCNKFRLTLTKDDFDAVRNLITHYNILPPKRFDLPTFDEEVRSYWKINQKLIEKGNLLAEKALEIDFSDMLYLPIFWKLSPYTKYDFVFIDECQDLSKSQQGVVFKYVKSDGRVLAVGDPYQSIYGFTGADIQSFDLIREKLKAAPLTLSHCFRCPDEVIDLAKPFRSDISVFETKKGEVINIEFHEIQRLVKVNDLVICRTKETLLELMFILLKNSIPVEVHELEVKEFINDVKKIFTPEQLKEMNPLKDPYFFDEVHQRNSQVIEKDSFKFKDQSEKLEYVSDQGRLLTDKIDFIRDQLLIHIDCRSISSLLNKIEKLISGGVESVKLSTIHRAKGLENETVFILDFDEMPLTWDDQKDWERQQELNLKYVALTRAKKKLYLVKSVSVLASEGVSLFDILEDLE